MLQRNLPNLSLRISPPAASSAAACDAPALAKTPSPEPSTAAPYAEESGEVGFFANPSPGAEPPGLSLGLGTPALGGDAAGRRDHLEPQGCAFKRAATSRASLPAGGSKRSSRAPRMRWTTALHARFVHAVELLGGHESKHVLPFAPRINSHNLMRCLHHFSFAYSASAYYSFMLNSLTIFLARARSVLAAAARP